LISVLWLITLPIIFVQEDSSSNQKQTLIFAAVLVFLLIFAALFVLGRFIVRKLSESRASSMHKKIIESFKAPVPDSTIMQNLGKSKLSIRAQLEQTDNQISKNTRVQSSLI
jgi:hypothetical protein